MSNIVTTVVSDGLAHLIRGEPDVGNMHLNSVVAGGP
jgi:hypothetical protein